VKLYLSGLREKFGNRLRTIRLTRNLSQEEFSELLGISVDFLSLIERGVNVPSFENLEVFSTQLGIPVHELFVFDSPKSSAKINI
jgi:transcriptional regulator with XRE-family HTH domain